ncbi:M23 family metallopeptidase [Sulfurimonas sp.]|uniref:M23 family metallopeptidase n=1 Tax=Sulfurimonas sp. TaxID=2022749 RepID=UPI002B476FAB|nr:M23 family metallopeptidase [Sulfurimonas sp.]
MKFFFLFLFLASTLFSFNIDIYDSTIANGKTTIVKFKKEKNTKYIKIELDKKKYRIYKHPSKEKLFYALIPINYYKKPKNIKAKIFYEESGEKKTKTVFFKVIDGKYKKEKIKVQKSKVILNKKDKKKVAMEYKEAMDIYNHSTNKNYITSKFTTPMQSKITSSFGKTRIYNDTLNGYHSGTDYRAKIGTPITASNSGKIVLVKDRFYSGGSIIIDHGHGIYTCYYHMSKFNVKKSTFVKKGQVIGLSGVSGRVTGPHLHFSARVGGEQVDPLQLIELINKNLF